MKKLIFAGALVVILLSLQAKIFNIHCIGCHKFLYRATSIEMILSPPAVANQVCWPCLIATAKVEGDGESVERIREWMTAYRSDIK